MVARFAVAAPHQHGVVWRDDALVFFAQDRVEIGRTEGDERIDRFERGSAKRRIVRRQVVLAQVRIGRLKSGIMNALHDAHLRLRLVFDDAIVVNG